jgi:cholesterol transport system auxiliary component
MQRFFVILAVFLSVSCSFNSKTQPAQHDFGLSSATTITARQPEITVTTPQWLWNQCIHFRLLHSDPTRLRCYSLDQWIASPPELFKQLLANKLTTPHRLTVEINEFEQQFDSLTTARVVLNLKVIVRSQQGEQILASQQFHLQQASSTPDAAGAVAGFADLTRQAADKIQRWLSTI